MAALPEPATRRAVSLMLHHTLPISLSPSLSASVIGFCLYSPTSIYHRSLSAISPSIRIVFAAFHFNSRLCCAKPLIWLNVLQKTQPIGGLMLLLWSYKSFVDSINVHKGNVMACIQGVQPYFPLCHEYFSDERAYEMSLPFRYQGDKCDADLLVIHTSAHLSTLSTIWTLAPWHFLHLQASKVEADEGRRLFQASLLFYFQS